jgi:hypothetical protein
MSQYQQHISRFEEDDNLTVYLNLAFDISKHIPFKITNAKSSMKCSRITDVTTVFKEIDLNLKMTLTELVSFRSFKTLFNWWTCSHEQHNKISNMYDVFEKTNFEEGTDKFVKLSITINHGLVHVHDMYLTKDGVVEDESHLSINRMLTIADDVIKFKGDNQGEFNNLVEQLFDQMDEPLQEPYLLWFVCPLLLLYSISNSDWF